jgi:hypothetical protein
VVLLDGREVDRMDRNMAKLLAKSDEQDRDTVRWMGTQLRCWWGERSWIKTRCVVLLDGREVENTVAALDRDTVRGAAGWERSG